MFLQHREAIDGMMKIGELTAQFKELEVALDMEKLLKAQIKKELEIAKENAEESKLEVKRVKLTVSVC